MKYLRKGIINLIKRWLVKLYTDALFDKKLQQATPIFVYQMGKVGSSSVYKSLLKQYDGVVLHSHTFSKNSEDPKIRHLYRWAVLEKKPIYIISLTREPISRNISAFFQNFERDTGVTYAESNFSFKKLQDGDSIRMV